MTKKFASVAELNKAIDAWGKSGQKWAMLGVDLGMAALAHHTEHGDVGPVNRLILAMPKGTKSSAMIEWFLAFGKLAVNTDKEAAKTSPLVHDKEKVADLAAAAQTPWFDFRPEPTAADLFDVQKALQAVLKKAMKATNVEHPEMLEQLKAILAEADDTPAGDPAPF